METRNPVRILMTIGTLSKIMEYTDRPRKLIMQLGMISRKTREFLKYQRNTLDKVHQEVVAELLRVALIRHKIHSSPEINDKFQLELFSLFKPTQVYIDFLTDIRDIGLPGLASIGIYLNSLCIDSQATWMINSILWQYYYHKLNHLCINSGSFEHISNSIPFIIPKITRQLQLNYVKIDEYGLKTILKYWHSLVAIEFNNWDFDELYDTSDMPDEIEYQQEYKLKRLYFGQLKYMKNDDKGMNLTIIKSLAKLLANTKIIKSLEEVFTTKDWFSFKGYSMEAAFKEHGFNIKHKDIWYFLA